jgi:preprotein translocase subunit YajC
MELKPGDCVRTESGEEGKVVHIDRLTVFVRFVTPDQPHDIRAFLKSTLTRIEPPGAECEAGPPLE